MGGTFDPIHHGHLVAASEVQSWFDLDEVVFVPTGQPYQKAERTVSPACGTAPSTRPRWPSFKRCGVAPVGPATATIVWWSGSSAKTVSSRSTISPSGVGHAYASPTASADLPSTSTNESSPADDVHAPLELASVMPPASQLFTSAS